MIQCTNCQRPYPETGLPYRCLYCDGIFDYFPFPGYSPDRDRDFDRSQPGIWRFVSSFGLPPNSPTISLGEGNTPLLWLEAYDRKIAVKCEFANPTGSFKDRGAATLLSFLRSQNVVEAIEDSSGNAGAAFAAYAARAGINARVYIPESASGPKRLQIERYGAEVIQVPGPRSAAADKIREIANTGIAYGSHAYLPQVLPGYATIAYEIFEQLGRFPGTLIAPVGQGNMLLAIARGFQALYAAGLGDKLPQLVGVQARACAPFWALFSYGPAGLSWVSEAPTLAEGVRVRYPMRGDAVFQAVTSSGGSFIAVDEPQIITGRDELAQRGFYVEPTSALVWDALRQMGEGLVDPVVLILTGSGLKHLGD